MRLGHVGAENVKRTIPRRGGVWRWFKRVTLGLALIVLVLVGVGLAYQAIATARDQRNFPPPGELLDVGGHRLHIQCAGTPHPGMATVILEAGTGLTSPAWALIQSSVSATTRVCAYDRAGNGWSESGPLPRDARQIANDLHTLLIRAAIAGPYVLVGHSLGGLYVRAYTGAYPDDVVGLVLIDSSHPDQLTRSPARRTTLEASLRELQFGPLLARLGIVRLAGLGETDTLDLPARERDELNAFGATPEQAAAVLAELSSFGAVTDQPHAFTNLGKRPLFVLSAGKGTDPDWPELQAELVELSSNSVHRTFDQADHTGLLFSRDGAKATSQAISAVLESARTGQQLTQ